MAIESLGPVGGGVERGGCVTGHRDRGERMGGLIGLVAVAVEVHADLRRFFLFSAVYRDVVHLSHANALVFQLLEIFLLLKLFFFLKFFYTQIKNLFKLKEINLFDY